MDVIKLKIFNDPDGYNLQFNVVIKTKPYIIIPADGCMQFFNLCMCKQNQMTKYIYTQRRSKKQRK